MRIVARRACQCVAVLEASAFAKILNLVGDMIVLVSRGDVRQIIVFERLPRPIAQERTAGLHGIAVALGADFQLALSRETGGLDELLSGRLLGMFPMI